MALVPLFILAVLATYRMALLLPEDDGPFFVFKRIRSFTATKAMNENDELGFWAMIDEGISCAYCMGLYSAVFAGALVFWNNYYGNLFLLIMGVAGGQAFMQRVGEK